MPPSPRPEHRRRFATPRPCLALALLLASALLGACRSGDEVVVFHDQSFSAALGDVADLARRDSPGLRIRLEPSEGSLAARKVSELGLKADLVVSSADSLAALVEAGLASWSLSFATDEVVLAHKDHSRFTDEISDANWAAVLARPGVRLGCADPATSPAGAHADLAWQLSGQTALRECCSGALRVPGEAELVALLESRAADYAFLHRSTAESHHLKLTALAAESNLSRLDLADAYARASLAGRRGAPIACALAVPSAARNPDGAGRFLAALLSEPGRRALRRAGFLPLDPPLSSTGPERLPEPVRSLAARAPASGPRSAR